MVAGYLIDNHYSSSEKKPNIINKHISIRSVSHQGHCLMSQTLGHQSPLPPADLGGQSKQSFCTTIKADDWTKMVCDFSKARWSVLCRWQLWPGLLPSKLFDLSFKSMHLDADGCNRWVYLNKYTQAFLKLLTFENSRENLVLQKLWSLLTVSLSLFSQQSWWQTNSCSLQATCSESWQGFCYQKAFLAQWVKFFKHQDGALVVCRLNMECSEGFVLNVGWDGDAESSSHAHVLYSSTLAQTPTQLHLIGSNSVMVLTALISSSAALPLPWNLLKLRN